MKKTFGQVEERNFKVKRSVDVDYRDASSDVRNIKTVSWKDILKYLSGQVSEYHQGLYQLVWQKQNFSVSFLMFFS